MSDPRRERSAGTPASAAGADKPALGSPSKQGLTSGARGGTADARGRGLRPSESALFACALLMAVVLGVLLAPVLSQPARAEMVSESGPLVAMTAAGGSGDEEILLVLDNRREQLSVYRVMNQSSQQLLQRVNLPQLFEAARTRSLGGN